MRSNDYHKYFSGIIYYQCTAGLIFRPKMWCVLYLTQSCAVTLTNAVAQQCMRADTDD